LFLGATMPLMTIVFGNVISGFTEGLATQNRKVVEKTLIDAIIYFCLLAVGAFFTAYGAQAMFMVSGENQTKRIREAFLRASLYQEIAFFDEYTSGDLTTRATGDTALIQEVLG
jgi:ABC-type multidrug transport system fused ATPase/permease subunit